MRSPSPDLRWMGFLVLAITEERELIDNSGDGLIHDGKGCRCARVYMRDGMYPINSTVHH